ncbi:MAG: DMT family transporter [Cytophagales bacterium]|nr:DMT family transporter [Cytophagales bacterium]MDW8384136.1 DMT family transporter [Flammeovirgaceae bacterium]
MKYLLLILPFLCGVAAATQSGINSQLRWALHSPIAAALVSFLTGTILLFIIFLVFYDRSNLLPFQEWTKISWYKWTGGALGAFFVTVIILTAQKVGATNLFALIISGQLITALLYDHFGILGFKHHPISFIRLLGVAFLLLGAWLINKK